MKTYIFTPNATKIADNLFLGNLKAALNKEFLKKENIQCIVEIQDAHKSNKRIEGVEYLSLEFKDRNHTDITPYMEQAIKFIETKHKENKVGCQEALQF